jgi:hypothetical protein
MLCVFIISTLILVFLNQSDKFPKGLKLIYYILYIIGMIIFLVSEIYRAIKR